jgi:hypothetical protein
MMERWRQQVQVEGTANNCMLNVTGNNCMLKGTCRWKHRPHHSLSSLPSMAWFEADVCITRNYSFASMEHTPRVQGTVGLARLSGLAETANLCISLMRITNDITAAQTSFVESQ